METDPILNYITKHFETEPISTSQKSLLIQDWDEIAELEQEYYTKEWLNNLSELPKEPDTNLALNTHNDEKDFIYFKNKGR